MVFAAVGLALAGLLLGMLLMPPWEVRAVKKALPELVSRLDHENRSCNWIVTAANEAGRDGWKIVRCELDTGDTAPAWYLTRTRGVHAQNAASKIWSKAPDPPEIAAWDRPGTDCGMMEYYDDCVAGVVIEHVRRVAPAPLPALQDIADQTMSFSAGHSAAIAAKIEACGGGSLESRCGQFTREMRMVELQVVRQIAEQRSQKRPRVQVPTQAPQ